MENTGTVLKKESDSSSMMIGPLPMPRLTPTPALKAASVVRAKAPAKVEVKAKVPAKAEAKAKVPAKVKAKATKAKAKPKRKVFTKKVVPIMALVNHNNKMPTVNVILKGGTVKAMDKGATVDISTTMMGTLEACMPFFTMANHKVMEKIGGKLFLSDAYGQYLCYSAYATSLKPAIGFDFKSKVIVANNNKLFDRKAFLLHAKGKHDLDSADKGSYSHIGLTANNAKKLSAAIKSFFKG